MCFYYRLKSPKYADRMADSADPDWRSLIWVYTVTVCPDLRIIIITEHNRKQNFVLCGVSSDLDGYRGALKREVFLHTFFCVLVRICNQTSSNQHLLVVEIFCNLLLLSEKTLFTFFPPIVGGVTNFSGQFVPN